MELKRCKTCNDQFDSQLSGLDSFCTSECKNNYTAPSPTPISNDPIPPKVEKIKKPKKVKYKMDPYMQDLRSQINQRDHKILIQEKLINDLKVENFELKIKNTTAEKKGELALKELELEHRENNKPTGLNGLMANENTASILGAIVNSPAAVKLVEMFAGGSKDGGLSGDESFKSDNPECNDAIEKLVGVIKSSKDNKEMLMAMYNAAAFYTYFPEEIQKLYVELNAKLAEVMSKKNNSQQEVQSNQP